jgi:uncharacterized protein YjbI with pentapeptide repeats
MKKKPLKDRDGRKHIRQKEFNNLVKEHNKWLSDKNNGSRLVLKDANLDSLNFRNKDLSYSTFENVSMREIVASKTPLAGSTFKECVLVGSDFRGSYLNEIEIVDSNVRNVLFNNAYLGCATIRDSSLEEASMVSTTLAGATIKRCGMYKADWTSALMSDTTIKSTDLRSGIFANANMRYTTLEDVTIHYAIGDGQRIKSLMIARDVTLLSYDGNIIVDNLEFSREEFKELLKSDLDKVDVSKWRPKILPYLKQHREMLLGLVEYF